MEILDPTQFKIPFSHNVIDIITGSRNLRDQLLHDNVDSMNPIRYETLTDEQKVELKAYRQALLDAPQQAGWPAETQWPIKPTWL